MNIGPSHLGIPISCHRGTYDLKYIISVTHLKQITEYYIIVILHWN